MPRIPIEPDSRLTRPSRERAEWAVFTLRRHYKNTVRLTARYIAASCQCGRILRTESATASINHCFDLSGFADSPLHMMVLVASDRPGLATATRSTGRWADLAAEAFTADVRAEVCRLGIDPASASSIEGAQMALGSPQWETASRHPHPFERMPRQTRERSALRNSSVSPSGRYAQHMAEIVARQQAPRAEPCGFDWTVGPSTFAYQPHEPLTPPGTGSDAEPRPARPSTGDEIPLTVTLGEDPQF